MSASVDAAEKQIADLDQKITDQYLIQKHCDVYRHCREIVNGEKLAKDPRDYRTKHKTEYELHDSTMKELRTLGIERIPSQEKIQLHIEKLESQKMAAEKELQNMKKQKKTLAIVQENMKNLLYADTAKRRPKQDITSRTTIRDL